MYKRILLTGRPGVGKTTLFMKLVDKIRNSGYKVGGFICPEVRVGGRRIGFRIITLDGSREGWLARRDAKDGVARLGSYLVLGEAEKIGVYALQKAMESADLVAIDEIGPMELLLDNLRKEILKIISTGKPLLAVVHWRLRQRDPEIYYSLSRNSVIYEVREDNRDRLLDEVYPRLLEMLKRATS